MIDFIIFKFESFDFDAMVEVLLKSPLKGVIVSWNYNGAIHVHHNLGHLIIAERYRYFTPQTWNANRWIRWPTLIVRLAYLLVRLATHYRVRVAFFAGGDILLWLGQILCRLGFIGKTTMSLEDWSLPNPKQSPIEKLNRYKLWINDWILARSKTSVIIFNRELYDVRKKNVPAKSMRNCRLFENQWTWLLKNRALKVESSRKVIVQLGTVRRFFGMELMFSILPELNKKYGFRFMVIGPESPQFLDYKSKSEALGLAGMIDWIGFVETSDLPEHLQKCFCGINLQELPINDSSYVISGRVVHYIQHLVTPILTGFSGALVNPIVEEKIGIICEPTKESLRAAIVAAHERQVEYSTKIEKFLASKSSPERIVELIS